MKLYRGIKGSEYSEISIIDENYFADWEKVLKYRKDGIFEYPEELNGEIIELHKLERLHFQHFTDNKVIAERYANENNGILITIDVSTKDILKCFTLEVQNYSKRREKFEIVYVIKGIDLAKNKEKWKLVIRRL